MAAVGSCCGSLWRNLIISFASIIVVVVLFITVVVTMMIVDVDVVDAEIVQFGGDAAAAGRAFARHRRHGHAARNRRLELWMVVVHHLLLLLLRGCRCGVGGLDGLRVREKGVDLLLALVGRKSLQVALHGFNVVHDGACVAWMDEFARNQSYSAKRGLACVLSMNVGFEIGLTPGSS